MACSSSPRPRAPLLPRARRDTGRPGGPLWLVAVCLLLGPAAARAQTPRPAGGAPALDGRGTPGDYRIDNPGWNGLSDLISLARGLQLRVSTPERIDWDSLGKGDLVMVLYPRIKLDTRDLMAFVGRGGSLVLADDFGAADQVLPALGLERRRGPVVASRYFENNPGLPVALPPVQTGRAARPRPLSAGITELVANHPSALVGRPDFATGRRHFPTDVDVLFAFDRDQALAAEVRLGTGRCLLLSDPSLFINAMLAFEGNLAFATRLLRQLGRPGAGRLVLATGFFASQGTLGREPEAQKPPRKPSELFGAFNGFLADFNLYVTTPRGLMGAAAAGLLATLLALLAVLPRSQGRFDGSWLRPRAANRALSDEEDLLTRLSTGGGRRHAYREVCIRLQNELLLCMGELGATSGPLALLPRREALIRSGYSPEQADRLGALLLRLERIADGTGPLGSGHLTAADLAALYQEAGDLLDRAPHPRTAP